MQCGQAEEHCASLAVDRFSDPSVVAIADDAIRAARDCGADLMVMGGYGHAPWREMIFGGATRTFLNADSPSLFLSH